MSSLMLFMANRTFWILEQINSFSLAFILDFEPVNDISNVIYYSHFEALVS